MSKNFISTIFIKDITALREQLAGNARVRTEKVAWPSEASANLGPYTVGECGRALFYKVIGASGTDEMSVRGRYVCDAGIIYEKYHIEKLRSMGMLQEEQKRIEYRTETKHKVLIAGKIDAILKDGTAIEMKSVSAFRAPDAFGTTSKMPLPFASHLMQAMLYRAWLNTEEGKKSGIKSVYLMYINRSDGSTFYYKVDLDASGYPVITALDQSGKEVHSLNLGSQKSYSDLAKYGGTTEDARIAELRINIKDIFDKFDSVYDAVETMDLPRTDFKMTYSPDELEKELHIGRISKRKHTMLKNGKTTYADYKCSVCTYKQKCLHDSGVFLK